MAAVAASASPLSIASTMRWCHDSTVSRSCVSTGALSRNEARNAASMTLPIERMNKLPEALATARCRARSPSAKPTESEASCRIARQAAAFGVTAGDDVDADAAGNLGVVGMRAPHRDDDKPGRHDFWTPALRGPARRAMPSMACCRAMKAKRRTPVTILVHQLDKVPSKLM